MALVSNIKTESANCSDSFNEIFKLIVTTENDHVTTYDDLKTVYVAIQLPCEVDKFIDGLRRLADKLESQTWPITTKEEA